MQCKRHFRRDLCSESEEEQQQQIHARQRRKHRVPASGLSDEGTRDQKKPGGYMKPEKFNATSCFETYLVQFDNCAKFNCWSENRQASVFTLVFNWNCCTDVMGNRRYVVSAVSSKVAISIR